MLIYLQTGLFISLFYTLRSFSTWEAGFHSAAPNSFRAGRETTKSTYKNINSPLFCAGWIYQIWKCTWLSYSEEWRPRLSAASWGEILLGPLCQIKPRDPGNKCFVESVPGVCNVVRKDTEIKTQIKQREGHRRLNKGESECSDETPLNRFASCSFIKVQFEMLDIQMQVTTKSTKK